MKVLKLALVLCPLLAANASAMVARLSPVSPRINPLVGLPSNLPSPVTGPLAGRGVNLPSPVLTPAFAPALLGAPCMNCGAAPLAAAPAAPASVPALPALLPESALFLAPAEGKKVAPLSPAPAAPAPASSEDLRNIFDGSRKPVDMAWDPILPRDRQPVPARRHGLPEDELERELGVDPTF